MENQDENFQIFVLVILVIGTFSAWVHLVNEKTQTTLDTDSTNYEVIQEFNRETGMPHHWAAMKGDVM